VMATTLVTLYFTLLYGLLVVRAAPACRGNNPNGVRDLGEECDSGPGCTNCRCGDGYFVLGSGLTCGGMCYHNQTFNQFVKFSFQCALASRTAILFLAVLLEIATAAVDVLRGLPEILLPRQKHAKASALLFHNVLK